MTTTLENKPLTLSEMRDFIGNISDHARGGNTLKATKTGAMVSVDDAYVGRLLGLTVYGNSVQDGTPTPESPVAIRSVAGIGAHTSGKNLFCAAGITKTNHGIAYTYDGTGAVKVSGTSNGTSGVAITDFISAHQTIELEPGSYTLSITQTSENVNAQIYDASTVTSIGSTTTSQTFNVNARRTVVVRAQIAASVTVDETVYIQLEKGNTATAWEPAVGSSTPLTLIDDQGVAHTLCRVGNYSDRLHINADGSGTLYATLCECDMTGDDLTTDTSGTVPSYAGTYTNCYGTASSFLNSVVYRKHGLPNNGFHIIANKAGEVFVKANSFVGRMYYDIINEQDGVACAGIINGGKQLVFRMDKTAYPTLDSAKAYFNEHPQHVIFKMAQEVAYHIPAINMPSLPDLVSNAWISATDADGAAIPCECSIEYRRDINKVIGDIEEAIADIVAQ